MQASLSDDFVRAYKDSEGLAVLNTRLLDMDCGRIFTEHLTKLPGLGNSRALYDSHCRTG